MKTKTNHSVQLRLISVMLAFSAGFAFAREQETIDTNIYSIFGSARSDDSGKMDGMMEMGWYQTDLHYQRDLRAQGLVEPMPEQLPAWRDTNGHWGAPVDRLQLSVRFHRREFLPGEPVHAMVVLRNLAVSPRVALFRQYLKSEARKNFAFVLRNGTNTMSWSWTDPKLSEWHRGSGYFGGQTMEAHSQVTFFVRLDQIFDLSRPGEYWVQARWSDRDNSGQAKTNVVSGTATYVMSGAAPFRVVDRLSPAEVAATNAWARGRKELEQQWREAESKMLAHYYATNKEARERLYGLTNKPSAK
jgi:hypothetical protein